MSVAAGLSPPAGLTRPGVTTRNRPCLCGDAAQHTRGPSGSPLPQYPSPAAELGEGDTKVAARLQETLEDIAKAIDDVDFRAANEIGMTRRLDPLDRVRELGDASVPFRFDVHALFFAEDAVGIETALHQRLADQRLNRVNPRREFFHATPAEVKALLAELAGDLLQFADSPGALECRRSLVPLQPCHRCPPPPRTAGSSRPGVR